MNTLGLEIRHIAHLRGEASGTSELDGLPFQLGGSSERPLQCVGWQSVGHPTSQAPRGRGEKGQRSLALAGLGESCSWRLRALAGAIIHDSWLA